MAVDEGVLHQFGHAGDDFRLQQSKVSADLNRDFRIHTYPQTHLPKSKQQSQSTSAIPDTKRSILTGGGTTDPHSPHPSGLVIRREEAKLCGEEYLRAFACHFEPVSTSTMIRIDICARSP